MIKLLISDRKLISALLISCGILANILHDFIERDIDDPVTLLPESEMITSLCNPPCFYKHR